MLILRRSLFILGVALIAVLGYGVQASPALADGGPHGDYRDTTGSLTDKCAACHRVHQGKSSGKLLKAASQYALCLTCHNGVGSKLNVIDGVKMSAKEDLAAGNVPRAAGTALSVSVAPYGELWAAAPSASVASDTTYTLRVRNIDAAPITVSVTCGNTSESATISNYMSCAVSGGSGNDGKLYSYSVTDSAGGDVTTGTAPSITVASGTVGYVTVRVQAPADAMAGGGTPITDFFATSTVTATVTSGNAGATPAAAVVLKTQFKAGSIGYADGILNGGGFRFVAGQPVTSRHNADPADNSLNPWGYDDTGETSYLSGGETTMNNSGGKAGALTEALQCTSCHNPHGTENYRLLKTHINDGYPRVRTYSLNGSGTLGYVKDENNCPGLDNDCNGADARPANKYIKDYYASTGTNSGDSVPAATMDANDTRQGGGAGPSATSYGFATFCGSCHTAYPSVKANKSLTGPVLSETASLAYSAKGAATALVAGDRVEQGTARGFVVSDTGGASTGAGTVTLATTTGTFAAGAATVYQGNTTTSRVSLTATTWTPQATVQEVHYRHITEASYRTWSDPEAGTRRYNPELTGGDRENTANGDTSSSGIIDTWTVPSTSNTMARLRLASNGGLDPNCAASFATDANCGEGGVAGTQATLKNSIVTCLTCHRVHGSAASISGWAQKRSAGNTTATYADEDLTPSQGVPDAGLQGGLSLSTLLYTNNRGMCESCHQW